MSDALERVLSRHHHLLRQVRHEVRHEVRQSPAAPGPATSAAGVTGTDWPVVPDEDPTCAATCATSDQPHDRRHTQVDTILEAIQAGAGIRAVARRLGVARNTVRRVVRTGGAIGVGAVVARSGTAGRGPARL